MGQVENLINLYQAGYQICLGMAIFFFCLALFIFFKFRILNMFLVWSGRAERKVIKQMQEANDKTGHLSHASQIAKGELTPESLQGGQYQYQEPYGEPQDRNAGETVSLNMAGVSSYGIGETTTLLPLSDGRVDIGKFQVTKSVVVVHTNERI